MWFFQYYKIRYWFVVKINHKSEYETIEIFFSQKSDMTKIFLTTLSLLMTLDGLTLFVNALKYRVLILLELKPHIRK